MFSVTNGATMFRVVVTSTLNAICEDRMVAGC